MMNPQPVLWIRNSGVNVNLCQSRSMWPKKMIEGIFFFANNTPFFAKPFQFGNPKQFNGSKTFFTKTVAGIDSTNNERCRVAHLRKPAKAGGKNFRKKIQHSVLPNALASNSAKTLAIASLT